MKRFQAYVIPVAIKGGNGEMLDEWVQPVLVYRPIAARDQEETLAALHEMRFGHGCKHEMINSITCVGPATSVAPVLEFQLLRLLEEVQGRYHNKRVAQAIFETFVFDINPLPRDIAGVYSQTVQLKSGCATLIETVRSGMERLYFSVETEGLVEAA